jgi:hypothetical protein
MRSDILTKILAAELVPVGRRAVDKLLDKFETIGDAACSAGWKETGRKPLLSWNEVTDLAVDLQAQPGFCLDTNTLQTAIAEKQSTQLKAQGIQPLTIPAPSITSMRNYKSIIATQEGISIARTALVKSQTCFTAENSLRSAMSFIATVATTHFNICAHRLPDVYKDLQSKTSVSDASRFLFNAVSDLHNGLSLQPIHQAYVLSTDDTAEFVF